MPLLFMLIHTFGHLYFKKGPGTTILCIITWNFTKFKYTFHSPQVNNLGEETLYASCLTSWRTT